MTSKARGCAQWKDSGAPCANATTQPHAASNPKISTDKSGSSGCLPASPQTPSALRPRRSPAGHPRPPFFGRTCCVLSHNWPGSRSVCNGEYFVGGEEEGGSEKLAIVIEGGEYGWSSVARPAS